MYHSGLVNEELSYKNFSVVLPRLVYTVPSLIRIKKNTKSLIKGKLESVEISSMG